MGQVASPHFELWHDNVEVDVDCQFNGEGVDDSVESVLLRPGVNTTTRWTFTTRMVLLGSDHQTREL